MECKYTAIVYTNNHVINSLTDNNLTRLIPRLLLNLNECTSGSYGIIKDNDRNQIIREFCKCVIDD